jgi:drug/metabolite transporter (DMT)-like permease
MKKSSLLLIASAFFWATSGLLTQIALKYNSTMMLVAMRFTIASVLALVIFKVKFNKAHLKNGFVLSLLLMGIYITSTIGLKYTSASNASFIIGSNVILVPIFNQFILKSSMSKKVFQNALLCLVGLSFITFKGSQPLNIGDLFCFMDAIIYSVYIIYSSRLSQDIDTKSLIAIQYTFVAIFSMIYVASFESFTSSFAWSNILALFSLGFFCTFLAFYFQLSAQKSISSEKASQLLALMPLFTVTIDVLFTDLILTPYAIIGMLLILWATNDHKFKVSNIRLRIRNRRMKVYE